MGLIAQNDFSLGWRPSDEASQGPKNSLLRMQNVKLDETGALTLIPGSAKYGVAGAEFTDAVHTVYSKTISGVLYRFATDVVGLTTGAISTSFINNLLFNGSLTQTAFGTAYNAVLICSGNKRRKFVPSYSTTVVELLGDVAPAAPTVTVNNPYTKDMTGTLASYTAVIGTVAVSGSYVKLTADATTLTGSANLNYGSAQDTTSLSSSSVGLDSDLFQMEFKITDPTEVLSVTVNFRDNTDPTNYFEKTFSKNKTPTLPLSGKPTRGIDSFHHTYFDVSPSVASKLTCTRGEFEIVGRPQWNNIRQITVLVTLLNNSTDFYFDNVIFSGGTLGSLDGDLEYIQRFRGDTLTPYTMYSDISAITKVTAHTASTHITPAAFVTVGFNGVQLYRRGGLLDSFYLVHDAANSTAFDDQLSDEDALALGIKLDLNEVTLYAHPTDDILQIVGPFFSRWLYFTTKGIYISKIGNPEIYSTATGVLTPYGDTSETFLWADKFGNSAILVGTTNDIYEITGTLTELPDGTIDINIRPTGCKNPPINTAHAATANELYYVASDSVRVVNFNGNASVGEQLDLFFKGKTRFSVLPPRIRGGNQDKFIMAIAKNELCLSFLDTSGARFMWAYDTIRKYWYEFKSTDGGYGGPVALFAEEDGQLLAAYSDTLNKYVRVLNTGTLIDGTTNPTILLRTKFLDADLPRQRKDSLTLKLKVDTGNSGIEFKLYINDSTTATSLGFFATNGLTELAIDLSSVIGIAKNYSLEIAGNCPSFKLVDFNIDFIERPVPVSYIRTEPTNFGVQGRKKLYHIPFMIDTVGGEVNLTPFLDGVAQTSQAFNTGTNGKQTLEYLFAAAAVCRDLFYKLTPTTANGLFEYYGPLQPRVIEALPDAVKSFTIPSTNFGTYSRKRIIAFAFVIDSNAVDFTFTPTVDGVAQTAQTFNTFGKQTAIYYFTSATVGVDIGGTITCASVFEFYEVSLTDCISEKLPPSTKFLTIPTNNLGAANKKRIRTIPLVIDTHNANVTFTPTVDGTTYPTAIFNTSEKRTVLYYFISDAFGVDVGGTLSGDTAFEFYGLLTPENVEILPVGKLLDQLGPISFTRNSNVKGFRVRLLATGTQISYVVYINDVALHTGSFTITANIDKYYEVPWLTKFLNGTTCRIELSSTDVFHRFEAQLKHNPTGAASEAKWSKIG